MELNDLFRMGAELIQGSSDDATSGIDAESISDALGSLFGSEDGGFDLSSLMGALSDGNLGETIKSWIGNGENMPIDVSQITDVLGSDKVAQFADQLGISFESAQQALADALPDIVDKATPEGESVLNNLLESVGGVEGAMGMFKKMFG